MRTRHFATLLLLAAALGLATTIAVAWALAAWLPHRGLTWSHGYEAFPEGATGLPPLGIHSFSRPGMVRRQWIGEDTLYMRWSRALGDDLFTLSSPSTSQLSADRTWGALPLSVAAAKND